VVITRLRGGSGELVPAGPTDEKIALWIAKAKGGTTATSGSSGDSGGGDSGGGGGGDSDGGGGSGNDAGTQSAQQLSVDLVSVSIDNVDCEVNVRWTPNNTVVEHRIAGDAAWQATLGDDYINEGDERYALLFNPTSQPGFAEGYPLAPNMDIEFRFQAGEGYPDGHLVESSETYRFNTGADPATPGSECTGGQIFP